MGAERSLTLLDQVQTRIAGRRHRATAFVSQPEPRTIGSYARGRQLAAGNFRFGGHLVQARGAGIWDIAPPNAQFAAELQGCTWLDDLARVTDGTTRRLAQDWVAQWIREYGSGKGPGWTPELTGRRVIRWINHALFLLNGQDGAKSQAYFESLTRQTLFLARRWSRAAEGLPRFEALTGLLYAAVSLEGMDGYREPAIAGIARECDAQIDATEGLPTRNPEHLMEVLLHLNWAAGVLRDAGREPPEAILGAIARIRPTLTALRHSDGGLARFHGGGRGSDGKLDYALGMIAGTQPVGVIENTMGYARLCFGKTTVIADTALPPAGARSGDAHASTLAFELSSGRRPMIVNCGSGTPFGPDWRRAGRATPSHSTLSILGASSAKLASEADGELLVKPPRHVTLTSEPPEAPSAIIATHDGYAPAYGLTHARRLELSSEGGTLRGEDTLAALSPGDQRLFDLQLDRTRLEGVPYAIRFHLHPEVEPNLDLGGSAVSLVLKGREVWVFRFSGLAELSLEPSVYLEKGRLSPRATKQIVLSCRVMEYVSRVTWILTRAQDLSSR
ncbi:MAG: heparinase [Litoreibacter sp.]|nr:heparinase [Litoreibacter sp.]